MAEVDEADMAEGDEVDEDEALAPRDERLLHAMQRVVCAETTEHDARLGKRLGTMKAALERRLEDNIEAKIAALRHEFGRYAPATTSEIASSAGWPSLRGGGTTPAAITGSAGWRTTSGHERRGRLRQGTSARCRQAPL